MARLGGCSVWPLLDVLKKGDDEWRGPAESSLVRIGRAAVPALIEAVESHDGRLQAIAARILGEIRDPEAIAALAAQFLTAGHKAREQMLAALKKIDATWRESGSGRELVHTLTNNLAAPDDRVRSAARDGLIAIRTAPAPALIDLLYSPVAGQVAADVLDSIDAAWTQSDEALRAVPALVAALGGSGGTDSSRCVSLLTKIGARAVAALEHLLTDPEQSTRLEAARVLAHCGDPRALKPVLEAIDAEALCSLAVAGTNANQSALIALACGRGGEAERLGAPAWLAREAGDWRVRVMAADGACALGCDRTMAQRLAADLLAGGSPGIPPYMAQVLRKLAHRAMVSEEIVALAIEALTVGTTMKTFPGDAYGNEYVSMEQGDAAVQKLCAHKEPLATAALELIARLSDITIRVKRCTWSSEETVSFAGRREQASSELRRRKSGG